MKRLIPLVFVLSGCAGGFAQQKMQSDIDTLRRDMAQLRADSKKTSGDVELRTRLAEMGSTLDQIRTDISLIQGRIESLQDAQSKKSDDQMKIRQELEIRIAQLDEQMRALQKQVETLSKQGSAVAVATPPPTPMGTLVVPDGAVKPTPLPVDPGRTIPVASPTGKLTDQQLYQKGIEARDGKRYADARTTFAELITKYPKSDYADNARYWIAETYYDEKDFASAILEFDKVQKEYPTGDKVPAALLKLGFAFLEIGEKEASKSALNELVKRFPKTEEAKKAKEKLAKLK
jgi:tol-pal system protein YbgF